MPTPTRVFLGAEGPLLERAARWLVERAGGPLDLGDTFVAVPGARAGRILGSFLRDAVQARCWGGFLPPRIVTAGRLVDELVIPGERPHADRLTRTVAWERALQSLPPPTFARIAARRPGPDDRAAWWRLADDVRNAHAELAVEGRDFAAVARWLRQRGGGVPGSEVQRFEALAEAQGSWRQALADAGLADPHEARRTAADGGHIERDTRVVLVGILELNGLARAVLDALEAPATALVFADEHEAFGFDDAGTLRRGEVWTERHLDLGCARWRVVEGPDDQAAMALHAAAEAAGGEELAATSVVFAVPDAEVVPPLTRRLSEAGAAARDAAGTPLERTAPLRLLEALEAFLELRSAERLATLLRHGDFESALAADGLLDAIEVFDGYRRSALPRAFGDVLADDVPARARQGERVTGLLARIGDLLGPLGEPGARDANGQVIEVGAFLDRVYRREAALPAATAAALDALRHAVECAAGIPAAIARQATAHGAVGLVRRAALAAGPIPPPPAREGTPTVELLGWLEVLLDPAPHVVVTGFNEGHVPSSVSATDLLSRELREAFGLDTDAGRHGRDAYVLSALARSSETLTLVSGRRTRTGEPLFPSRLAFARPEEDVPALVDRALSPERFAPLAVDGAGEPEPLPGFAVPRPAPEEFTVTSFATYIESPALFHVRRELGLSAQDDRLDELDGGGFGDHAHAILEAFGRSELVASSDSGAIFRFLDAQLARVRRERFPGRVLAAVELQLEQLRLRLRQFAEVQAAEAAAGWRVEYAEWTPSTPALAGRGGRVALTMRPGEPKAYVRGVIDRIDRHHGTGAWRVLDYKTSAKSADPEKAHGPTSRKPDAAWKNLQLPLYAHMVRAELAAEDEELELGYFNLPGDGTAPEIKLVGWGQPVLDGALERAAEIVREMRETPRPADIGRLVTRHLEPVEAELFGVGLAVAPGGDDGEEEA